jgi:hypothetical protein
VFSLLWQVFFFNFANLGGLNFFTKEESKMIFKQKNRFPAIFFIIVLILTTGLFFLSGCKGANKLNPEVSDPQIIVNPDNIRMGVAHVTKTEIVFQGSGFQPDDSVFISLVGPDDTKVALADAKVYPDGKFTAKVTPLAKVTGILKANITGTFSTDGTYNQILVITRDPIPAGAYTAVATGMISNQQAEVKFTIGKPNLIDNIKDWLGKKMGKIQFKKE